MRRLSLIVTCAIAVLALTGCSGPGYIEEDAKALREQELIQRGFTNILIDTAYAGQFVGYYAKAYVSVGACRIGLEWSDKDSWRLEDKSKIDDPITGELTAETIRRAKEYADCASKPTLGPKPS